MWEQVVGSELSCVWARRHSSFWTLALSVSSGALVSQSGQHLRIHPSDCLIPSQSTWDVKRDAAAAFVWHLRPVACERQLIQTHVGVMTPFPTYI